MLRVYWLEKVPLGVTFGDISFGRKPRLIVLLPAVNPKVRAVLKITGVLVSAQVATIKSWGSVVDEVPSVPVLVCPVLKLAVTWVAFAQLIVILAICCEVAKSLLFSVPNDKFWVRVESMEQLG